MHEAKETNNFRHPRKRPTTGSGVPIGLRPLVGPYAASANLDEFWRHAATGDAGGLRPRCIRYGPEWGLRGGGDGPWREMQAVNNPNRRSRIQRLDGLQF